MKISNLKLVTTPASSPLNGTVTNQPPRRQADTRSRKHLLESEVEALMKAAGRNRYASRDAAMILIAYRHGLRVSELTALRWSQVDFDRSELHVTRVKGSLPSTHPLTGREMRALRRLKREQQPASVYIFTSERGAPFSTAGFRKLLARLGKAARFPFLVHPHMLRHATGFKLASDEVNFRALQSYMGHATLRARKSTPEAHRASSRTSGGISHYYRWYSPGSDLERQFEN